MDENDLIEDDDALDYIIYEKMVGDDQKRKKPGCFIVILVCVPTISVLMNKLTPNVKTEKQES